MAPATIRIATAIVLTFGVAAAQAHDAASGLPSGKRQHKPITITKETDAASPKLLNAGVTGSNSGTGAQQSGSGGGTGKVKVNKINITKTTDAASPILFQNGAPTSSSTATVRKLRQK